MAGGDGLMTPLWIALFVMKSIVSVRVSKSSKYVLAICILEESIMHNNLHL